VRTLYIKRQRTSEASSEKRIYPLKGDTLYILFSEATLFRGDTFVYKVSNTLSPQRIYIKCRVPPTPLAREKVVEHKSVVLWRAKEAEDVPAFDQIRLEMFFGSMVFTPDRKERNPPGTDRVLNWAAYGLWEDQNKHLLSAAEVADKKKLNKHVANKKYEASPKGKETRKQYAGSESGKETRKQYAGSESGKEARRRYKGSESGKQNEARYEASEGGKETRGRYAGSESGKEARRRYEASEGRKQNKRQAGVAADAAGAKKAREFQEESEKNKRPAVQKTNEPSCGVLGDLLGGS
jgi:hypothetical protein